MHISSYHSLNSALQRRECTSAASIKSQGIPCMGLYFLLFFGAFPWIIAPILVFQGNSRNFRECERVNILERVRLSDKLSRDFQLSLLCVCVCVCQWWIYEGGRSRGTGGGHWGKFPTPLFVKRGHLPFFQSESALFLQ